MNEKQKCFVKEYLVDLNATQAAIRAGYSKKTARSQGQRLLTKVDVADAIAKSQGKRSERTEITQDMVLTGLHNEATFTGEGSSQSARVSVWSWIGKHLAMFSENNNASMSNEALLALIDEGKARARHNEG